MSEDMPLCDRFEGKQIGGALVPDQENFAGATLPEDTEHLKVVDAYFSGWLWDFVGRSGGIRFTGFHSGSCATGLVSGCSRGGKSGMRTIRI